MSDALERRATEVLKAADRLFRLMAVINLAMNLRRAGSPEAVRVVASEVTDADT